MTTHKFLSIALTALIFALSACEKPFSDLEKDPNRPTTTPASLVLKSVLNDMYDSRNSPAGYTGVTYSPWGAEQRWNQFYASNYDYYANNQYNWTTTNLNFTTLKDVIKMEQEAARASAEEGKAYAALGKFFRAYFYDNMTKRVGDVPLTDALKGLDNLAPKYDSQKAVYVQILKWLDEANTDIATLITERNSRLSGDFYFNNDLTKWQKAVNTFKLRVLISLSKKQDDADLGVKAKFAEVLANPTKFPLMTSAGDNLQYLHTTLVKYPRSPSSFGYNALRENLAKTYVDLLVNRQDPRLFVIAEPASAKVNAGLKPTDFAAFVGASSGEDLGTMSNKAQNGEYSFQNRKRYYSTDQGEPVAILGYPELQFNIAEGINRGWTPGDADAYYQKGIQSSWSFYGLKDGANDVSFSADGGYKTFSTYSVNVNFATYYAQPLVKYAGNNAGGLAQILTQKYLAFAQNSGLEAFYNQRRTGVPAFLIGVGTNSNQRIPMRWQYPASERTTNATNWKAAITSQFAGSDDQYATMWILQ